MVYELRGVVEREGAEIGVLVARGEATKPMREEASAAGEYSDGKRCYPRIQLLTAEDIISGKGVEYPAGLPVSAPAKQKTTRRSGGSGGLVRQQ